MSEFTWEVTSGDAISPAKVPCPDDCSNLEMATMTHKNFVMPDLLYKRCDAGQLPFKTTAELEDLSEILGQPRAMEAVRFGLGMRRPGFNLFLLGVAGTGEYPAIRRLIEEKATKEPTPADWCYVNNFEQPERPRVLQLPPGRGTALRDDVRRLLEELRSAIPAAFESENYRARKRVIEEEIKERKEKGLEDVAKEGEPKGIGLLRTVTGFVLAPMRNKEVLDPDQMSKLSEEEATRIEPRDCGTAQEA